MSILDKMILRISELIEIRTKQMLIYKESNNTKESNTLTFKIKNYKKWIETLNQPSFNTIPFTNKSDIEKLKLSDKL